MAQFLVLPLTGEADQIKQAIEQHIAPNDRFEIDSNRAWLIDFPGTPGELNRTLGTTDGTLGSILIAALTDISGYGSTAMYSWIDAHDQNNHEIEALQVPPVYQPCTWRILRETFKIIEINSENPELWKIQLENVSTGEQLSATLEPYTLFLELERAYALFEYQKQKTSLDMMLRVVERASGNSYSIERIIYHPTEVSHTIK